MKKIFVLSSILGIFSLLHSTQLTPLNTVFKTWSQKKTEGEAQQNQPQTNIRDASTDAKTSAEKRALKIAGIKRKRLS